MLQPNRGNKGLIQQRFKRGFFFNRLITLNGDSKLSSIKTELLVAMIFLILGAIGSCVFTIIFIISVLYMITTPYAYVAPFIFLIGFIGLIFFIPTIVVLVRVRAMHSAAQRGNISELKSLNSLAYAIIALVLTGIIPGIMLIIAYSDINSIDASVISGNPVERLDGLKKMLDDGIITKDEFEAKKEGIIKVSNPVMQNIEELRKLKEMRDTGVLTEEEYTKMKKNMLSKY